MRRGRAATWRLRNERLLGGEFGLETDTGKLKIGDGLTAWNDLPYMKAGTPLGAANAGRGVMIDVSNPEVPVFSVPGYEGGAGIDITNGVITNTRAGIVLAGVVADYAHLPHRLTAGAAYLVSDDGLIYVYDGSAWPAEGDGIDLRGGGGATMITLLEGESNAWPNPVNNPSCKASVTLQRRSVTLPVQEARSRCLPSAVNAAMMRSCAPCKSVTPTLPLSW
ncbi:hypothetical protein [Xylella fastidiosa]|uniref:hyaluronate lyase N-terminal domain-containing protein n=1 Tax=Xylella fastidiosa TaxID=2371 RepID=UPI0021CAA5C7|nr:hypothetical protein [Xylella fastidiosa]